MVVYRRGGGGGGAEPSAHKGCRNKQWNKETGEISVQTGHLKNSIQLVSISFLHQGHMKKMLYMCVENDAFHHSRYMMKPIL